MDKNLRSLPDSGHEGKTFARRTQKGCFVQVFPGKTD
jgi:hypothetical protein